MRAPGPGGRCAPPRPGNRRRAANRHTYDARRGRPPQAARSGRRWRNPVEPLRHQYTNLVQHAENLTFSRFCASNAPERDRTRARRSGQLQHLPGLDLVRVAQLIPIELVNLHIGVAVAEMLLRDLAQGVARFDGIGRAPLSRRRTAATRAAAGYGDVCDHFIPPLRDRLDRGPELVLVAFALHRPHEVQLAPFFVGAAVELTLRCRNRISVLVTQTHSTHLRTMAACNR